LIGWLACHGRGLHDGMSGNSGGADGSRKCAADDRLRAVAKDEATELENAVALI